MQRQAPDEVHVPLKGWRWLLVRNREDLTTVQRTQLETVCTACAELKTGARMCCEDIPRHVPLRSRRIPLLSVGHGGID